MKEVCDKSFIIIRGLWTLVKSVVMRIGNDVFLFV